MAEKNARQEFNFPPPRERKGYALTEYLETNAAFIALLTLVKGADQIPAYVGMRKRRKPLS